MSLDFKDSCQKILELLIDNYNNKDNKRKTFIKDIYNIYTEILEKVISSDKKKDVFFLISTQIFYKEYFIPWLKSIRPTLEQEKQNIILNVLNKKPERIISLEKYPLEPIHEKKPTAYTVFQTICIFLFALFAKLSLSDFNSQMEFAETFRVLGLNYKIIFRDLKRKNIINLQEPLVIEGVIVNDDDVGSDDDGSDDDDKDLRRAIAESLKPDIATQFASKIQSMKDSFKKYEEKRPKSARDPRPELEIPPQFFFIKFDNTNQTHIIKLISIMKRFKSEIVLKYDRLLSLIDKEREKVGADGLSGQEEYDNLIKEKEENLKKIDEFIKHSNESKSIGEYIIVLNIKDFTIEEVLPIYDKKIRRYSDIPDEFKININGGKKKNLKKPAKKII